MFWKRTLTGNRTLDTNRFITLLLIALVSCTPAGDLGSFVDPSIGSEGLGRVFVGPSMPFGMVKPGPDCTVKPNAGWAPMPEVVTGFSQTHVSGTGGGQKYGNILIQPFEGALEGYVHEQLRASEEMRLGYYTCTYENGIKTQITTADRASFYKIDWGKTEGHNLLIDCGFFLGENPIPKAREAQQFEGSGVSITGPNEVCGHSSISGGWNNGDTYTVYFCLQADEPFSESTTYELENGKTGALVAFDASKVNLKIGISFVSEDQARSNIPSNDFDAQLKQLRAAWEKIFSKVEIKAPKSVKRQFYTALYHTCLMPVDRSGENPSWGDTPYYDDYYAIWDTYRSSTPLLTLLMPEREVELVNSLLNIYKNEVYMPDARSGNCNGRTQGGSNAEVVIADAYAKGLKGIDYELALEAMIKDATVPPADDEKEGRGGLKEYNTLGYIPYGIPRAGTRTIEYAFDDWCIAQVAKGLGHSEIAALYEQRSGNWRKLWRADYCWDGMYGFIMPKDADGNWLDEVPWGKSSTYHPTIPYTPVTKVAPWYLPWWNSFFYEALSEEYSLSVPHDVQGLIDACGGQDQFRDRLDLFFEKNYYNVANEPSFLTPCYYHWIGHPELSSARIEQIIADNYNDSPTGLPGNDDGGAMSSWLVFHLLGFYPNAGTDYYLVHSPLVKGWTIHLPNGQTLKGKIKGRGHFAGARLNGSGLEGAILRHSELLEGGELVFGLEGPAISATKPVAPPKAEAAALSDTTFTLNFTLNRQYRNWPASYKWDGDTLEIRCNGAIYRTARSEVENAEEFCWLEPKAGAVYNDAKGSFCFISQKAYKELDETGFFTYNGSRWGRMAAPFRHPFTTIEEAELHDNYYYVQDDSDGCMMAISRDKDLPFVAEMIANPLGIDWKIVY